MTHVVCVGDVMVDVVARLPGPLAVGSDTPAAIELRGGGAAANVAAWLVAAGASATFVGRVGADAFGERSVADLTASGVGTAVVVDPELPTGTCIVLVDPDGERTMIPSGGANAEPGDVDALPATADWLYLSGYTLLRPATRDYGIATLRVARSRGWRVAVDIASTAPLIAAGPQALLDDVGGDLLLLANAEEATVLTDLGEPAAAARALALRCGQAVVKSGRAGAVWSDGSGVRSVAAAACDVVDSTGAGDAFAAGYLSAAGPDDVLAALRVGAEIAARAVGLTGARPHVGHVA